MEALDGWYPNHCFLRDWDFASEELIMGVDAPWSCKSHVAALLANLKTVCVPLTDALLRCAAQPSAAQGQSHASGQHELC